MALVCDFTLMRLIHKKILWGAGPRVIWTPNNCKKMTKLQQCTCHHIKHFTDVNNKKKKSKAYLTAIASTAGKQLTAVLTFAAFPLVTGMDPCGLSSESNLTLRPEDGPHLWTAHEPIQNGRFRCGHKGATLHTKVALALFLDLA